MPDLDLTSQGQSRSKLIHVVPNEIEWAYDFLTIITIKIACICQRFKVTSLCNIHDLDLTSSAHSRSTTMVPNKRPYLTSYPLLIINLAVSARVSK